MRDRLLFAVVPYLGAVAFVVGSLVKLLVFRRPTPMGAAATGRGGLAIAGRLAFAAIAIGHVLTLGFPRLVLSWDRDLFRLLLLEGTRLVAGCLAVIATIVVLARLLRPMRDGTRSLVDVVAATLLLIGMISGVAVAVLYRWASSWSEVTLVPYLYSLALFEPVPQLVTGLPALVKLHVVSAFAIVAILPFTGLARAIVGRLDRLGRRLTAPVSSALRPAWLSMGRKAGAAVRSASTLMFHNGEEEN